MKKFNKSITLFFTLIFIINASFSQQIKIIKDVPYTLKNFDLILNSGVNNLSIASQIAPFRLDVFNTEIISAKLYVYLDANLDDNSVYRIESNKSSIANFKIENQTISYFSNVIKLEIDANNPKSVYYLDLTKHGKSILSSSFKIDVISISDVANVNTLHKKFKARVELIYGNNLLNNTTQLDGSPVISAKQVKFSWSNNVFSPIVPVNYEFQLLKLYNSDPSKTSQSAISTEIDWSKAMTLETKNANTFLSLTLAEGTGFYAWRVRPIANYYEGGYANSLNKNENQWSYPSVRISKSLTKGAINENSFFYFDDVDDNKNINYIYTRYFTEGGKIKESITYADGLQQVKQTQVYMPSKDIDGTSKESNIISQNFQDKSGRNALSTMPEPNTGKINGYKENYIKNEATDKPYNIEDFDNNSSSIPQKIKTDKDYYGPTNLDLSIPDAQGFSLTKTKFSSDGSNRVAEQSGVGQTHMIGGNHTNKTFFGTASDEELIKLFGDEAPADGTVFKTINQDPNGTQSVQYTSKEGQVIATGMIDDNEASTLESLGNSDDEITKYKGASALNIVSDGSLTSVKRFIVSKDNTIVNLSYNLNSEPIPAGCNNLNIDCGYTLSIKVFNADDLSEVAFPVNNKKLSELTVNSIGCKGGYTCYSIAPITLQPGSYVISKKLTAGKVTANLTSAEERTGAQIKPLTTEITSRLKNIKCKVQLVKFYEFIESIEDAFKSLPDKITFKNKMLALPREDGKPGPLQGFKAYTDSVLVHFKEIKKDEHNFSFIVFRHNPPRTYTNSKGQNVPKLNKVHIKTPCCDLNLSLDWTPPFRCPKVDEMLVDQNKFKGLSNDRIDVNPLYGDEDVSNNDVDVVPDFEGYALNYLSVCPSYLRERFQKAYIAAGIFGGGGSAFINKIFPGQNLDNIPDHKLLKSFFYGLMRGWRKVKLDVDNPFVTDDNPTDIDKYANKDNGGIIWARVEEDGYVKGEGTFNLMIFHMLTDSYRSVGLNPIDNQPLVPVKIKNTDPNPIYDECGNTATPEPQGAVCNPAESTNCTQYTCDQLITCWLALISKAKFNICTDSQNGIGANGKNNGTSNAYSERTSNEEHDSKFDDKIPKFIDCDWWPCSMANDILDWATGTSKKVREAQEEAKKAGGNVGAGVPPVYSVYNENIPSDFLRCVGYKFAAILSPEKEEMAKPLFPQETSPNFTYFEKSKKNNIDNDLFGTIKFHQENNPFEDNFDIDKFKKPNGDVYYVPFNAWKCQSNIEDKTFNEFPFIHNPVYAFKYFTYAKPATPEYSDLERSNCYRDPNDCYTFVLENGKNVGKKIPCCATYDGGIFNYSKCYKDYEYPNVLIYAQTQPNQFPDEIANSCNSNEPIMGGVKERDSNGKPTKAFKYIVSNFCGYESRFKCMYDNQFWSSGQRESFYYLLKSYTPPSNAPNWKNPPEVTQCSDYITPYEWATYSNQGSKTKKQLSDETDRVTKQCTLEGKFGSSLRRCVRAKMLEFTQGPAEVISITRPIRNNYDDQLTIIGNSEVQWDNPEGTGKITKVSRIDIDVFKKNKECLSYCDIRRATFQQKLDQLLKDRCYERNNCCQESQQTNIVTDKDYYAMIDEMVKQCKSQCKLQSFTCKNLSCRSRNVDVINPGIDGNVMDITFGIGNNIIPNSPITGQPLPNLATMPNSEYIYNKSLGSDFGLYDYSDFLASDPICENGNYEGDAPNNTYEQYMLWKQASSWDVAIDLPSKCPVGQVPRSLINCDPAATNTFVPKNVYEQNVNTPLDMNNMNKDSFNNHTATPAQNYQIINGQIISPAIKLEVKVTNTAP